MSIKTIKNTSNLDGIAVFGTFDDFQTLSSNILADIRNEITGEYKSIQPIFGKITQLSIDDSKERVETFRTDLTLDERPYSFIYLQHAVMMQELEGSIRLLSEKRKLKLIPLVYVEKPSNLYPTLADAIFGNIGNFVIGNLTDTDLAYLKTRINIPE